MKRLGIVVGFAALLVVAGKPEVLKSQAVGCNETIAERKAELGCWQTSSEELGSLPRVPLFWHLYNYSSRAAAEKNKGLREAVVESFGKVWLFGIEGRGYRPSGGKRVAVIGPLTVDQDKKYTARYMEAVSTAGMQSTIHRHAGPEAWYMLSGAQCLETSNGIIVARVGHPAIVEGGPPMLLNTVGKSKRRAVVLVLHDSSQPWVNQASDWAPRSRCAGIH